MQFREDYITSTPTESNKMITDRFPDTPRPSGVNLDLHNQSIDCLSDHSINSGSVLSAIPRLSLSPEPGLSGNPDTKVSFDLTNYAVVSISVQTTPDKISTNQSSSWNVQNSSFSEQQNSNFRNSSRISMLKCRICLDYEKDNEKLLSPCRCKGTVGLMHSSCLEQWIQISANEHCEICKCKYDMRKKKPNCRMWFQQISRQKSFVGDSLCFLFLVPSTITAVYFCIKAALFLFSPQTSNEESQAQWRGMGLVVLAMLLIFCLVVWIVFTAKNYLRNFYNYQNEEFRYSIHNRQKSIMMGTLSHI